MKIEGICVDCQGYLVGDRQLRRNERRTFWVVLLTALMMVAEVVGGHLTGSMALVADGWHMGSHAGALLIAFVAYRLARSPRFNRRFTFGAGKLIPLGGYTSAVILAIVAILVTLESVERIFSPVPIAFDEAIAVACLGFVANVISALILREGDPFMHGENGGPREECEDHSHDRGHEHGFDHVHEGHEHDSALDHFHHHHVHDHNLRSAFVHIVMDAVTTFLAVGALVIGKLYHQLWLDPATGIFGALIILAWAYQLCRETGFELLDVQSRAVDVDRVRARVGESGGILTDFHAWRIAPKAIACELVVETRSARGSAYYRELLQREFGVQHVVVEERASGP